MSAFTAAVREWQEKTCIRFKERTNERAYVEFVTGRGGYAWLFIFHRLLAIFFIAISDTFVYFFSLDVGPMVSEEMVIECRQLTWILVAGEKELWCMKLVSLCHVHFSAATYLSLTYHECFI
jgi:hypothetical protein